MSSPELRASDADRDRTVAELREHTAVGRLTLEEFSERADRAVAAKTLSELEEIRGDLPAVAPATRARRRAKWLTGSSSAARSEPAAGGCRGTGLRSWSSAISTSTSARRS
jgi:hypothetical protein